MLWLRCGIVLKEPAADQRNALQLPNSQRIIMVSPFVHVTAYASNPDPLPTKTGLGVALQACCLANCSAL